MNVLVFGAGGKTGTLAVEQALAKGHTVSVFVREAHAQPAGVKVITGDASNADDVKRAVAGHDAVIDTIGGKTPWKATELESTVARNIIAAMKACSVRRLVVVSALGAGESGAQAPFWYEYLLVPTFLRGSTKDKTTMENEVAGSGLDFVIARPPILTDDAPTGQMHVVAADEKAHKITRADLAHFLVDQLTSDAHLGHAVVIANR